jgi:hypothetical protein
MIGGWPYRPSPPAYRVQYISTYRQVSLTHCSAYRVLTDKLSRPSLFRIQTTYRTEPPVIGLSGPNRWTRYTTGQGGPWDGHDKTKKGRKELVTLIPRYCAVEYMYRAASTSLTRFTLPSGDVFHSPPACRSDCLDIPVTGGGCLCGCCCCCAPRPDGGPTTWIPILLDPDRIPWPHPARGGGGRYHLRVLIIASSHLLSPPVGSIRDLVLANPRRGSPSQSLFADHPKSTTVISRARKSRSASGLLR